MTKNHCVSHPLRNAKKNLPIFDPNYFHENVIDTSKLFISLIVLDVSASSVVPDFSVHFGNNNYFGLANLLHSTFDTCSRHMRVRRSELFQKSSGQSSLVDKHSLFYFHTFMVGKLTTQNATPFCAQHFARRSY